MIAYIHITCLLLPWASGGGGATNGLSHVLNKGITYGWYHTDGMINSTYAINYTHKIESFGRYKSIIIDILMVSNDIPSICSIQLLHIVWLDTWKLLSIWTQIALPRRVNVGNGRQCRQWFASVGPALANQKIIWNGWHMAVIQLQIILIVFLSFANWSHDD